MSKRAKDSLFAQNVAILGGGNIGQAIAAGLVNSGDFSPSQVFITRRHTNTLRKLKERGFVVSTDNIAAVESCRTIMITVQPGQFIDLLNSVRGSIKPGRHLVLSTITGVTIEDIAEHLDSKVPIVRIMPNTAIAIGESMTCLAVNGEGGKSLREAVTLFNKMGKTLIIKEEQMTSATALCACGIAFFLRAVRAASQGGIQIGFPADEALRMAAQTARGAASLLQGSNNHPESEIDKVTTPKGCTISGLNRMEHEGFSSAMIKGLVTASEIAHSLFAKDNHD